VRQRKKTLTAVGIVSDEVVAEREAMVYFNPENAGRSNPHIISALSLPTIDGKQRREQNAVNRF
jgi:hypothetical protein